MIKKMKVLFLSILVILGLASCIQTQPTTKYSFKDITNHEIKDIVDVYINYGPMVSSVDKFNGIFVGANLFITRLEKLTYKINDLGKDFYYNTLVKANEKLNFLTVVEFDRVKLGEEQNFTTTVSSIRWGKNRTQPCRTVKTRLYD